MASDGPQRIAKPIKETSFEWSSALIACVALIVGGLGIYLYQPASKAAEVQDRSELAPVHRRVDFDMFPGRYEIATEVIEFRLTSGDRRLESLFESAFVRSGTLQKEVCLSPGEAQYNLFSNGFAENCITEENRSFPGTIDVIQSCSSPGQGFRGMKLRLQGNVTTQGADVMLAGEFEVPGAGAAKTVMKGTMKRLGDCAS